MPNDSFDSFGDADMPDGMKARPGQGDIEELTRSIMPNFDVEERMPPPVDDRAMIDDIEGREAAMVDDLKGDAVRGQELADERASAEMQSAQGSAQTMFLLNDRYDPEFEEFDDGGSI